MAVHQAMDQVTPFGIFAINIAPQWPQPGQIAVEMKDWFMGCHHGLRVVPVIFVFHRIIPRWIVHAMHICVVQRFLLPLAIGSVCTSLFFGAIYTINRISLL
jgi:hypothetical protein